MSETVIDDQVVESLLCQQHPDLAVLPISPVPGGWDNKLWRLGDELAVRLPRSAQAATLLRNELYWLPRLASSASLPTPVPVRVGEPSLQFPYPWAVVRWVPGEPADRSPIRAARSAGELAEFLRNFHQPASEQAPRNPKRGVPLGLMANTFEERLALVAENVDSDQVRRIWDAAARTPDWTGSPVWLHADLHAANVVTVDGALAGIIDFGCLCAGDPATDLAAAWTLLPSDSQSRFFAAYGDVDEATVMRARGWAVLLALMLVAIGLAGDRGRPGGQMTWGPAGHAALRSCCRGA